MSNVYFIDHEREDIRDDYFNWLCNLVDADDPDDGYLSLMDMMFNMDFDKHTAILIPNDDNRIIDGLDLREDYFDEMNYPGDPYKILRGPCSVLEMLVALAYRIADNYISMTAEEWFWEMLRNLGIADCTDDEFHGAGKRAEVRKILRNLRNRKYDRNGLGGLFPVKDAPRDQRKIEIWSQMNQYLIENEVF